MTRSNLPFNLSPKAVLAFLFPFLATVVGVVITWVSTGEFDEDAIRTGVAGLLAALLALIGAYVGRPGDVVEPLGTPSDDALSADAEGELAKFPPQQPPEKAGDA